MTGLTPKQQIESLLKRVQQLQEQKYFGKVTLHIQAGNILRLTYERSELLGGEIDGEPVGETQEESRKDQASAATT